MIAGQSSQAQLWVRAEVDERLRDDPDTSVAALLARHERGIDDGDWDPQQARAVADELKARIAANVRFWPQPAASDWPPASPVEVELDDEIPW